MRLALLRFLSSFLLMLLACSLLVVSVACGKGRGRAQEIAYVSAPQAILRDHVAAVYLKTGVVKNGERLEVLEREKRFVRVRTTNGTEGWIEQRYLVSQAVYDGFQALLKQSQNEPVQATGSTRNDTNLHLEPGRETEHLFQLNSGSKVSVLKRATAEKNPSAAPARAIAGKGGEPPKTVAPILEDWWLIRDPYRERGMGAGAHD